MWRRLGERAFLATAIHQTFRGSGFVQRGGVHARGGAGLQMRVAGRTGGLSSARGDFKVLEEVQDV